MSEHFGTGHLDTERLCEGVDGGGVQLDGAYDHMYATNHDENGIGDDLQGCHEVTPTDSEVNFLKEFLLIHLDLIQQQNDDILSKENTIFLLQQENAKLRERLSSLEKGQPYQSTSNCEDTKPLINSNSQDLNVKLPSLENLNLNSLPEAICDVKSLLLNIKSPPRNLENIVPDELTCATVSTTEEHVVIPPVAIKENEVIERVVPQEAIVKKTTDANVSEVNKEIKETVIPVVAPEVQIEHTIKLEMPEPDETSQEINAPTSSSEIINSNQLSPRITNDHHELNYANSSYTVTSSLTEGGDPMQNLKMSIRRKRLCSTSSAVSNNDSTSDEKRHIRHHSRKKRKRMMVKNDEILTCDEQYVTQVGDESMDILRRQELADEVARQSAANLEVPRWRVKVYTSCYTMEGTENLEDDVFLRRHSRLENDERRRKRWDVQRIREQRIVEKLKQRQERIDANNRVSEQSQSVESLWPSIEDIKFIEVCNSLPVSAFGCPIPKVQPSVFSLPWMNNPHFKKTTTRKSNGRRRGTKR